MTPRLDGIKAAAIVAFTTFLVFDVMVMLRVNIFLDTLTGRLDWQNLMLRFHASGSESLRAFIHYHYVTQAPVKILVATMIGAVTGVIGGLLGRLRRPTSTPALHEPPHLPFIFEIAVVVMISHP